MKRWMVLAAVILIAVLGWLAYKYKDKWRPDQFVFVGGSELNDLDPQRMSWLHDIRVAECLWEPLLKRKLPQLTLEGGVAERWEISSDKLTYTFHLRPEARWSNGDPVDAADFLYAWRRAIMPDLAADYTQLFFCIEGAEAFFGWRKQQLEAYRKQDTKSTQAAELMLEEALARFNETVGINPVDDKTLVVKLARPTAYFLELCAFATFMPVHVESIDEYVSVNAKTGMIMQNTDWLKPGRLITNGPYRLKSRRFKRDLLMEANEHYWNAANVGTQRIRMDIIEDANTALVAYRRGKVHWLPDIPTASSVAADLVRQKRPDVHVVPSAGTYFYNFNCQPNLPGARANPLADSRVRRALSMGIDRKVIVAKITRLHQPVARTFVPPGAIAGYQPPVEAGITFNLKEARKLLAQAGYPGGRGLGGLSILYNNGFGHENIAQVIKRLWEEHLGVVVRLEGIETRAFGLRLKQHNYTIARAGWFGDYRDPTTFLDKFRTNNGNNDAAWSNEQFDEMMRQADSELDPQKRMQIMQDAETLMLREQPVAPIFQYVDLQVFDPKKVRGLYPNAWVFRRLEFVQVLGK